MHTHMDTYVHHIHTAQKPTGGGPPRQKSDNLIIKWNNYWNGLKYIKCI